MRAIPGVRVGVKRSDMRWKAPDDVIWASKHEYAVYLRYKELGHEVRKTTEADSLLYTSPIRGGACGECGSNKVAQSHSYTPDLYVVPKPGSDGTENEQPGYYVEAKGYLRGPARSLLRSFRKAWPGLDLRFAAQRDYRVGKGTLVSWAKQFMKVPITLFPEVP